MDLTFSNSADAHPLVVFPAKFTFNGTSLSHPSDYLSAQSKQHCDFEVFLAEIFQTTSVPRATSIVTLKFSTSVSLGTNQTLSMSIVKPDYKNVWTQAAGTHS
jgi:hypothetical protein